MATVRGTFGDLATAIAFGLLLLPLALLAARRVAGRRDPVEVAVGIATAAALLVAGGLALSLFDSIGTVGWLALVAAVDVGVLLLRDGRAATLRRAAPVALAGAAVSLAVAAVAISHAGAVDHARESRFTQLWLVPRGPVAELGVRNDEQAPVDYRVRVTGPAGGTLLDRTLRLDASRTWTASVPLATTATPKPVRADLFRAGLATPVRSVHVWTNLTP